MSRREKVCCGACCVCCGVSAAHNGHSKASAIVVFEARMPVVALLPAMGCGTRPVLSVPSRQMIRAQEQQRTAGRGSGTLSYIEH
jgi:hypothetical protein